MGSKKLLVLLAAFAMLLGTVVSEGTAAEETAEGEEGYEVDNALELLDDLLTNSKKNLYDLESNWKLASGGLKLQLSFVESAVSAKEGECAALDDTEKKTREEIEDTKKFIDWLVPSIQTKKDKLHELLQRRCEVNKVFIHQLKRDKIALTLLEFIKQAIANKQSFTFAQQAEYNKHLASFLAAYRTNDIAFLVQMKDEIIDASQYNVDVDFTTKGRTGTTTLPPHNHFYYFPGVLFSKNKTTHETIDKQTNNQTKQSKGMNIRLKKYPIYKRGQFLKNQNEN